MELCNIFEIEGMEMPAGRRTRVMIGQNGAIKGDKFCQGYVVVYPGGTVPAHEHETVESYTILKGEGELTVDGEVRKVKAGDYTFIPPMLSHALANTGEEDLHMMFVYSPSVVVDHWAKEQSGELK